ncbi:MAG: hypothetical protein H6Q73_1286 [Firmicutes bacterium]|nr:hypothetical protein [Bacillota bacterium]
MFDAIRQREFGLGDIIKTSFMVYGKQIKSILLITLIMLIPINAMSYFCEEYLIYQQSTPPEQSIVIGLALISLGIFMIFIGIAWKNIILLLVEKAVDGENAKLKVKSILKIGFFRVGSCIFAIYLGMFICFGLSFLLIIPGIVWMLYYVFVQQAVVLRGVNSEKALVYSKSLVKGRWWRTFGKLLVIGLIYLVLCIGLVLIGKYFPSNVNIILKSLISIVEVFLHIFVTIMFLNIDYIINKMPEV